jgi:hypothetical protein
LAAEGDAVLSGKLRYGAVLDVAGQPRMTYETSTFEYILEAGPSTVGVAQTIPSAVLYELCRDKDGCRVSLQMAGWDPVGEPGAVASQTGWLFLSESSAYWRTDDSLAESGVDGPPGLTDYWPLYDCYFSDAETGSVSADNTLQDQAAGFSLLNRKNSGVDPGSFDDATTICRLVVRD